MFKQAVASDASTENLLATSGQVSATTDTSKKKPHPQQSRQLLSCTKCRERKVKCDRTKPCSACCARGQPRECEFRVGEGSEYVPIQQSYEIRKLRAENLRLKERLRAGRTASDDDEDDDRPTSPDAPLAPKSAVTGFSKIPGIKQRKFKGHESSDNMYFGSPGLANLISDFASLDISPQTLTHAMPRAGGAEIYGIRDTMPAYPFPPPWKLDTEPCTAYLLNCLPQREELMNYLDTFQHRAQLCSFPHTPNEITPTEIERFLSDAAKNAIKHPDMLALLFAALALGTQHCVFDKCDGKWDASMMETESNKGNVYIACAMQSLRMASFMNRPSLLGIQTLIMIGPYLTNSGRFLDAWTLFGTTIRLAHSIGLHRNPKYLDPAPPLLECSIRQTLWWWMLHMDQQYSMTLGRPLGISGIGDCAPPQPLTTNPTILRLGEYINQFTVLARQVLSSDRLTHGKIDSFTDALKGLWDTVPEILQFDESWLNPDKELPEWPLDALAAVFYGNMLNYLILLNRQRRESTTPISFSTSHLPIAPRPLTFQPINTPPEPSQTSQARPPSQHATRLRGRTLVIQSSYSLLNAFLFFHLRCPAALICWTMGQQAFNSCMILILDALETADLSKMPRVEKAFVVFVELQRNRVHKLAGLAVERVSWGLNALRKKYTDAEATRGEGLTASETSMASSSIASSPNRTSMGATTTSTTSTTYIPADTVMGETGMLLLEDPGLQSFAPESFSPLKWDMLGGDARQPTGSRPTSQYQLNQQQQGTSNIKPYYPSEVPFPGARLLQPQPQLYHSHTLPGAAQPDYQAFNNAPMSAYSMPPPQPQSNALLQPNPLDFQNPQSLNLGGNPGWAARSAAAVQGGQAFGYGFGVGMGDEEFGEDVGGRGREG